MTKQIKRITDIQVQTQNANRHTQRGMGALERSIQQDGHIGAITVAADGETFDGSARVEVDAALFGDVEPIVIRSNGDRPIIHIREDIPTASDPRAVRLSIAANRVPALNLDFDPAILTAIAAQDIDLSALFTEAEWAGVAMPEALPEPGAGGDEFDASPVEGPTRTAVGDLWLIDGGRHRLVVGDSTDPATVGRLMGGERADLALTDPPYGVSYADKNRFLNAISPGNRIQEPIANDHDDVETTARTLWEPAFTTLAESMKLGAVFYVFSPQGGDQMMMMMMMKAVLPVKHELMWLKNNHVLGRADYAYKHEPVLYGWKPGAGHNYYGGFQTSVLVFDRPQKSGLHPTTKPLELVQHLMGNSSKTNDLVIDWFLGSGTTLIAAHRTGRRCYGCEIEPKYADVILRRAEVEGLPVERTTDA